MISDADIQVHIDRLNAFRDDDRNDETIRIIEQQRRALQTIERMADPTYGFPLTGAGTKLRMGPTVLKKAAEIHTYARAGLGKEEFPV